MISTDKPFASRRALALTAGAAALLLALGAATVARAQPEADGAAAMVEIAPPAPRAGAA